MDPSLDKESIEYLEALAQITEELEFCVNLCKSRVMMVTCFDISMPSTLATQERLREVEVWGQKQVKTEKRKWKWKKRREKKCSSRSVDIAKKKERARDVEWSFTQKQNSRPSSYSASCQRNGRETMCVLLPLWQTYSRVNGRHLKVPFLLLWFETLFLIWCGYLQHT